MSRALSLVVSAVVLVAGARLAEARYGGPPARLEVWPSGSLAPQGFILISVEGAGRSDELELTVAALRSGDLSLEAADGPERVPLERVSSGDGRRLSQALFRPVWSLQLGTTYRLRLGSQELSWRIQEPPGLAAPEWVGPVQIIERLYLKGCPSQSTLLVKVPLFDGRGRLSVLVKATSLRTAKQTELVVPVVDHLIDLGFQRHGSGLDLVPMEDYLFELSALDEAGNLVRMPGFLVTRAPGEVDPLPEDVREWIQERERPDRSWLHAGWAYGLGLIGLAFALGATFLCVRFIVRSDR